MSSEHPAIARFRAEHSSRGGTGDIVILPDSVHTAALAAEARYEIASCWYLLNKLSESDNIKSGVASQYFRNDYIPIFSLISFHQRYH